MKVQTPAKGLGFISCLLVKLVTNLAAGLYAIPVIPHAGIQHLSTQHSELMQWQHAVHSSGSHTIRRRALGEQLLLPLNRQLVCSRKIVASKIIKSELQLAISFRQLVKRYVSRWDQKLCAKVQPANPRIDRNQ